jgi:serine/threonine protein kinase
MGQNILHRDLKLENILLKEKDKLEIKISDFGCSKIDPLGTTICGTPKYMALELL